ncbi:caspase activity and apoptosis inhibitor 1 [Lepisosteus oculatus]|uniref:caspase activity and apoptosis inhibitor 1 n=1 Tax=Lepisosteus oculatus TaxID=7918 RepID=UPI00074037D0|nr:PREDICTED: caspase activity and apoptosis inhibitor 1 [Lepisosteus oculatus]
MTGKKSAKEKKRKRSHSEGRHVERKRRSTESSVEDLKVDIENESRETDEPSDIEEGGLNLDVPFRPISAYITDRQEMLEQCFRVLGETKLKKMLPEELKNCSFDEIKRLCLEQLEQISQRNLLQILEGDEVTGNSDVEEEVSEMGKRKSETDGQQDNSVDSTSSMKENAQVEDHKQGGASGDESDALSINADTCDSDIEGHKEEPEDRKNMETAAVPVPPETGAVKPADPKKELQKDIEKSVSEILALATPNQEESKELVISPALAIPDLPEPVATAVVMADTLASSTPAVVQPSAQQLELLELEMRARAIKALMKANEVKKQASG